jgi:hypothetical protein
MRRAVELAAAVLALGLVAAPRASAEEPADAPPTTTEAAAAPALQREAAAPNPSATTFRFEVGGGFGSPLGSLFVDAVYAPNRWLAFGAGGGFLRPDAGIPAYIGTVVPRYGAFARANLLRRRSLALGPVLTFSAGDLASGERYMRPQYAPDSLGWSWKPGYRLDGGVGVELRGRRVSARIEAGVGYVLNQPTCTYSNQLSYFQGSCDSPELPAYYHFSVEPGRVTPYVSLVVGAAPPEVSSEEPSAVLSEAPSEPGARVVRARADDPRVDSALAAPTALTQPRGHVAVTVYELFLPQVTIGVTDRLQVAAGLGWFYFSDGPLVWDASVKLAVASASHLHVALTAGTIGFKNGGDAVWAVGAGPVLSVCIDEGCESVVSASALGGNFHLSTEDGPTDHGGVLLSPSAVLALVRHVKVVAEAHVPAGTSDVLWAAGLRVPFGPLAVDGGVLQGKFPVGSVTWRW